MERKDGIKTGLFPKFLIIFIGLVFILAVIGIVREYIKSRAVDNDIADLQAEMERLNLEKSSFLKSIDAFQSDFFVEEEARTKFNLKKEGERVMIIPLEGNSSVANDNQTAELVLNDVVSPWEKAAVWWNYFFGDKN